MCRVIQCTDPETINEIVKYNNTQNEITTWDQYSNDPDQNRIYEEFQQLGHFYSRKRGFRTRVDQVGIEEVAQPLLAFHGKVQDSNRGKNLIFERKPLYRVAFEDKKATHVLLVYALARAIDSRRIELKTKSSSGAIISMEEDKLALFRSLRFKSFLIGVVARCLETIIGRKVDAGNVAFTLDSARADQNTIYALAAVWAPVVEAVLSFISTKINSTEFAARSSDEELLNSVAKYVSAMLYAAKKALTFPDFISMLSDS